MTRRTSRGKRRREQRRAESQSNEVSRSGRWAPPLGVGIIRKEPSQPRDQMTTRSVLWIAGVVLLVLIFAATIRLRLLEIPLERDEGEYAYVGQLILQGIPPYRLAYTMKLPGTSAAYAAIMAVFGQTIAGIHMGVLIINSATILLVFLLGRHLLDSRGGALACASYAILSLSPSVLGTAGHATHFVVLPALAGLLLLLIGLVSGSLWMFIGSGLLVGLAALMKQPGVFFVAFALAYVVWHDRRVHAGPWTRSAARAALLALGAAVPFSVMGLVLFWTGAFDKFWFWTVSYGHAYGSQHSLRQAIGRFRENVPGVLNNSWPLWALGAIGLALVWREKNPARNAAFLAGLSLCSFLAVCPGFFFRPHYFIVLLPAIALLSAVTVSSGTSLLSKTSAPRAVKHVPLLLFLAALSYSVWAQWEFLFQMSPRVAARSTYHNNPFPESIEIGRYIRSHSNANDRIAVFGSEPQIYFLSGRRSATGYIYTYPLMEAQPYARQMQLEMIDEIERASPQVLVAVSVPTSWLPRSTSRLMIADWANSYIDQHFQLVGVIDIVSPSHTEYRWDGEATTYVPRSRNVLRVYQRKGEIHRAP